MLNDHAIVGFWPLSEPSGALVFKNHAHYYGLNPSGISFDLLVHTTDGDDTDPRSAWPGTTRVFEPTSGTYYTGYYAGGNNTLTPNDGPFEKVLVLGTGGFSSRRALAVPQVAQSGFTIGAWILPQSDGFTPAVASMTKAILGPGHALLSKGGSTAGFFLGCSGKLANDARSGDFNNNQLRGYAYLQGSTVANSILLSTPIESGTYTHIAATYRHIDGTNNQWVLYRNGRVAGSGTTNQELSNLTSIYNDSPLCVGGSLTTSDRIDNASGWGNLISGVYAFERPLHEGELLSLHNLGGLQVDNVVYKTASTLEIDDPGLIGYYPFISPGFIDASKNHNPLISVADEGLDGGMIATTGPFDRGGTQNNAATSSTAIFANSGLVNLLSDAANSSGFTINAVVAPKGLSSYLNNMMISFGSIGTAETPTLAGNTAGFFLTCRATTNGVRLLSKFFNDGDPADSVTLVGADSDIWLSTHGLVSLIYDNATNGVAMYLNGDFQGSGTLTVPMGTTLNKLKGLGYSLVFLNGSVNAAPGTFTTNAGIDTHISDISIFNRPLREDEIRGLAYSGIDISPLHYTRNDPRLRTYWKCTGDNKFLVPDNALVFEKYPANLSRGLSDLNWSILQSSDNTSSSYKVDYFSGLRGHPELPSLDIGISSGVWSMMGGSRGHGRVSSSTYGLSSIGNFCSRIKPAVEDRDLLHPHHFNEWILSFDVTPSGTIPPVHINSNQEFNSLLFAYSEGGDNTASDRFISYLTSVNSEIGSGISIVFLGVDGGFSTVSPLLSGNLVYGVPNKVLFHMKSEEPYYYGTTTSSHNLSLDLYISGIKVSSNQIPTSTARIWSDGVTNTTSDDWVLEIGGYHVDDTFSNHTDIKDSGLGEIGMREIFLMNGKFSRNDILFLSTSGIANIAPDIYNNSQSTTQVTRADANLQFLYRFGGGLNGSGTKDLSLSLNDLDLTARYPAYNSVDNILNNLRFLPGPIFNNFSSRQLSGITFEGNTPAATQIITPYAISGVQFDDPDNSFSIGFWYCQREAVASNTSKLLVSYGNHPTTSLTTTDVDAIWSIVVDDSDNIKMIVSKDGRMYVNNASNAAKAGSFECGSHRNIISSFIDTNVLDVNKKGNIEPGHIDSWNHCVWTYNSSNRTFKCFINGHLVDERHFDGTFNSPPDATSRIIGVFVPMTSPWTWQSTNADIDGILTDLFYFDRALTDSEVRYIAFNGIADVTTTSASGVVGGFIHGLLQGSGIVGGYLRGIDFASGIVGGYLAGAQDVSGIIGSYIQGLNTGSGIVGAFLTGAFDVSGIIGGYTQGSLPGSGIIGAFINGGLSGNYAFDTSFIVKGLSGIDIDGFTHIKKHGNTDFDAVARVFNSECIPGCYISNPSGTIVGTAPATYHFIGVASGCQGKTIESARWTFGDMSAPVYPSVSGQYYYPTFKTFNNPGKYVAKFSILDSNGVHNAVYKIIDLTGSETPITLSLSGIPQSGNAELSIDFSSNVDILPAGVIVTDNLVDYDDGTTSRRINDTHIYYEHGRYIPVWTVRDSRGFFWSDTLTMGANN